jgi:hypothetical protein
MAEGSRWQGIKLLRLSTLNSIEVSRTLSEGEFIVHKEHETGESKEVQKLRLKNLLVI